MPQLPDPIRRQVEAAEALLPQPTPETPAGDEVQDEAVAAPPPAADEHVAAPAPAPEAPPVLSDVEPEPPAKPADSEQTWEQRYRSLQGLTNRNSADFKQRLHARDQELDALRKQVQELTARAEQAKPDVDPNDVETFGEDLVRMVQRAAEQTLARKLAPLDGRLQELDRRVDGTSHAATRTAEELFFAKLREQVPDVDIINTDPGFLHWLAEEDPVYGVTRQSALDQAGAAMDVARVARVFNAYKGTSAPASPVHRTVQSQLEKQVAPRATSAPPTAGQPSKRIYTSSEVTAFYDAKRRGAYRNREADAQREEAAINAALAEGRISP